MALGVFVFITWIFISIFTLIPKRLSIEENIILFFITTIMVINIYTFTDLNIRLIEHSTKPDMFISLWLHRNIIIPISLVIFVNFIKDANKYKKIFLSALIFFMSLLIEVLTLWFGIKTYHGWNLYFSAFTIAALMLLASLTIKGVTKLSERM